MDYCSTESELIESLDYLTLPVKRSSSLAKDSNLCGDLPTRTRLLRDYRKKVSHKTQTSHSLHKCNESLILNSTKEEITEYYAFISSTENTPSSKFFAYLQSEEIPSQIKDQSLIKVTVTPKITKPHKPNVFTRRKHNPKYIHSTVSDEDRSIQTRNVYLVVSEQKRENHYNIRTTESAKLLNDINKLNDEISLEQVQNVKQVIHSLNMDKKRKKGGTVNKEKRRTGSPSKIKVTTNKEGKKEDNKQRKKDNNEDKKEKENYQAKQTHSIVRITGQIGLGNNNQLLMRCGVEGREAPANVELKSCPVPYFHNTATLLHTVTQGTQMDMEMINTRKENAPKSKSQYYRENVACFCKNVTDVNQFDVNQPTMRHHNQAERGPSPLVVITVYPNDERCESVKIYKQPGRTSPVNIYEGYTDVNCIQETNHYTAEGKYYLQESDTPIDFTDSPVWRQRRHRSVSKILKENQIKDTGHSTQPRSQSQSTNSSQNIKWQGTKNKDIDKSAPKSKSINSPRSPRNQSPNKNSAKNIKQQVIDKSIPRKNKNEPKNLKGSNQTPKNRSPRSHSPSSFSPSRSPSTHSDQNIKRNEKENRRKKGTESKQRDFRKPAKEEKVFKQSNLTSAGTNTDHTWTKRALVETFTKEVLGQMENRTKRKNAQRNESQVTINIDGDNENYDVLFQQGRRTTDVRVKKTVKRPSARRYQQDENSDNNRKESSLTNLLDAQNTRETDYTFESPTTRIDQSIVPEIKVRDSLEIGHKSVQQLRRESVADKETELPLQYLYLTTQRADNLHQIPTELIRQHFPRLTSDNTDFPDIQAKVCDTGSFAPIKHYKGDDCPIPDPVKRDKEIRHLLGIEKQSKRSPPIPNFKKRDPRLHFQHYQEGTRTKKEVTNMYLEPQKNQVHQLIYQLLPNRISVGTQYEPENVPLQSPFSKKMILNRNIQVFLQVEKFTEQKPIMLSRKQYHKVKKAIEHTMSKHPKQKLMKAKYSAGACSDFKNKEKFPTEMNSYNPNPLFANKDTTVLFTTDFKKKKESTRQSVSSGDVRNSYAQHLNESSTKVAVGSAYSHSVHTIFRGFRKPRTPNLGTSTCSFYSGNSNEFYETVKQYKAPLEKPRKPFLRRLISCLVLRASTASGAKMAAAPKPKASYNSCTVDSYHINTSLAALEMSSSIYDTSESFYSNHSILPINNKIKRSFFGSVRGLLTYGRN